MGSTNADLLRYVAANVRRVRVRGGMTQEQLAERADLDLSFVQRVERAKVNPSVRTLGSLAQALGVEAWTLLKPAKFSPPVRGRPPRSGSTA